YDTHASFTAASSWTLFDLVSKVAPRARSYSGGAFDGRYVYLAPRGQVDDGGWPAARYDTRLAFDEAGSWGLFDLPGAGNRSAIGVVFDGRYATFIPSDFPP